MKIFIYALIFLFTIFDYSNLNAQWVKTHGLDSISVECLAIDKGVIIAGTNGQGLYLSSNRGNNWLLVNNGLNGDLLFRALLVKDNYIFAGTYLSGAYISSDQGISWSAISGLAGQIINTWATNETSIFAGSDVAGVFISKDNGTDWSNSNGLTYPGNYVNALTINGPYIFAGTYQGVFLSTDEGIDWVSINGALSGFGVSAITSYGTDLFAGTNYGVYDSPSYSDSWYPCGDLGVVDCFAVDSPNVFAGFFPGGVSLSTNGGSDWNYINEGLKNIYIYSLAIDSVNIYAGTSNGVWARPLSDILESTSNRKDQIPSTFLLSQNYPNPFNPSTTINYSIPKQSNVLIKVYDVLGKQITTLINKNEPAGNYSVEFNANKLTSGVYFYMMQAGDFIQTKKSILLK
jgi:hypothetical protein